MARCSRSTRSSWPPDTAPRSGCSELRSRAIVAVLARARSASSVSTTRTCISWVTTTDRRAACETSGAMPALPRASLQAVIPAKRIQERRNDRVKDDWNRTAEPSLIRTPPHPDHVADDHSREIHAPNPHEDRSRIGPSRLDETASAALKIQTNPRHQCQHDDLTEEQDRIRKKARLPLLHRGQPPRGTEHDDDLTNDPKVEQHGAEGEEEAVGRECHGCLECHECRVCYECWGAANAVLRVPALSA